MPANLTPEYKAAAAAFRKARNPGERLEGLREMLRASRGLPIPGAPLRLAERRRAARSFGPLEARCGDARLAGKHDVVGIAEYEDL